MFEIFCAGFLHNCESGLYWNGENFALISVLCFNQPWNTPRVVTEHWRGPLFITGICVMDEDETIVNYMRKKVFKILESNFGGVVGVDEGCFNRFCEIVEDFGLEF